MGLDYVEIIMEVEVRFGIQIADRDAERLTTVGAMSAHIVAALRRKVPSPTPPCLSSHFFYRVRRDFLKEWDVGSGWLKPTTRVFDVIPPRHQKMVWRRLCTRMELAIPANQNTTVADLVKHKVEASRSPYVTEGTVNEQAVWNDLCDILARLTGTDRERITPRTNLITELGV